jgi:formamidopyrimidine-DNA glycosylase
LQKQLKSFKIKPEDLLKMSEAEIRIKFKNYEQISLIKTKVEKDKTKKEEKEDHKMFLSKFAPCPKCHAPIEKIEGLADCFDLKIKKKNFLNKI